MFPSSLRWAVRTRYRGRSREERVVLCGVRGRWRRVGFDEIVVFPGDLGIGLGVWMNGSDAW